MVPVWGTVHWTLRRRERNVLVPCGVAVSPLIVSPRIILCIKWAMMVTVIQTCITNKYTRPLLFPEGCVFWLLLKKGLMTMGREGKRKARKAHPVFEVKLTDSRRNFFVHQRFRTRGNVIHLLNDWQWWGTGAPFSLFCLRKNSG